jgi:predicted phosphohydrolase
VIIPGDVSWAMHLHEAKEDFALLESLPGTKYLSKGNHDFWWETAAKMGRFFSENEFSSLRLLYNNAYVLEDYIVCGTRGWFIEESQQHTVGTVDYSRIINREIIRLRMSIDEAVKLRGESEKPILLFFHFPPVWCDFVCREIVDVLHEYNIKTCYHGHIHGMYGVPRKTQFEGIDFIMCAADHLLFSPLPVFLP